MRKYISFNDFRTLAAKYSEDRNKLNQYLDVLVNHAALHAIRTTKASFYNELLKRLSPSNGTALKLYVKHYHSKIIAFNADSGMFGNVKGTKPLTLTDEQMAETLEKINSSKRPLIAFSEFKKLTREKNKNNNEKKQDRKVYDLVSALERLIKRVDSHYKKNEIAADHVSIKSALETYMPLILKGIDRYTLEQLVMEQNAITLESTESTKSVESVETVA